MPSVTETNSSALGKQGEEAVFVQQTGSLRSIKVLEAKNPRKRGSADGSRYVYWNPQPILGNSLGNPLQVPKNLRRTLLVSD